MTHLIPCSRGICGTRVPLELVKVEVAVSVKTDAGIQVCLCPIVAGFRLRRFGPTFAGIIGRGRWVLRVVAKAIICAIDCVCSEQNCCVNFYYRTLLRESRKRNGSTHSPIESKAPEPSTAFFPKYPPE